MSVAVIARQQMSWVEFEAYAFERQHATAQAVSQIVDEFLGSSSFDAVTCEMLIREGAIKRLNDIRHLNNQGKQNAATPVRSATADANGWGHPADWLDRITWATSDGRAIPLADFCVDDWSGLYTQAVDCARGWRERAKAAKYAMGLLGAHNAETSANLPADAREELAEMVRKAWEQ